MGFLYETVGADAVPPPPVPDVTNRRLALTIVSVCCLVVVSWLPNMLVMDRLPSYGDEGMVAQAAFRIVQGQVPFKDFFSVVTPGSYYWSALFLSVFGPTFFALRLGTIITAASILATANLTLWRMGCRSIVPFVLLSAFLGFCAGPSWFVASHHWVADALCLASFALLVPLDKGSVKSRLMLSGTLAAVAAFSLQHQGVLWILAASIALGSAQRSGHGAPVAWFLSGVMIFAVPVSVVFIASAGWKELFFDAVVFPLTRYHRLDMHQGVVFRYLVDHWESMLSSWRFHDSPADVARIAAWHLGFAGTLVIHVLPFAGAALLWRLRRQKAVQRNAFHLLVAFFVSMYVSSLNRPSDTALTFAAPAAAIVVAVARAWSKGNVRGLRAATWVWIVLFGGATFLFWLVGVLSPKAATITPAGKVYTSFSGEHHTLSGLNDFFEQNAGTDRVAFCYPYNPMFYFLFHLKNPTRYDTLTYPMHTQSQLDEAQAGLERTNCRYVIWNLERLGETSFNRFLVENYRVAARYQYAAVLVRVATGP